MLQKWNRKDALFKNEKQPDGKNIWRRDLESDEIAYRRWLDTVRDPVTKVFYKGHEEIPKTDEEGNAIEGEMITKELEPFRTVTTIIRRKIASGEEFLLSIGMLYCYTQLGDESASKYSLPEKWEHVHFKHAMANDGKGHYIKISHGPNGLTDEYTLPFTKDAAEELYKMKDPKVGCQLVVEDGNTGRKQTVPNIDLFTTKGFEYLMERNYMTPQEKEQERIEFEKKHPELVTTPKTKK